MLLYGYVVLNRLVSIEMVKTAMYDANNVQTHRSAEDQRVMSTNWRFAEVSVCGVMARS